MILTVVILITGVIASALSVVFIRESTEPPVMLAAYRVLIAAIVLLPIYLRDRRTYGDQTFSNIVKRSFLPGLILAAHFILWVVGARMTSAANANLIVNLMPIIMPFFMLFMFNERIRSIEVIATLIAIVGMLVLGLDDYSLNRTYFHGDLVCLLAMFLFAFYLALARRYCVIPSVWLYIVPVYATAGFATLIAALFFSSPLHQFSAYNVMMIMLLALVSTVIGHSALNYAMQRLRGQTVSVVNMAQFIIGGICGYLLYQEIPTERFYVASAWLVVAMGLVIYNQSRTEQESPNRNTDPL